MIESFLDGTHKVISNNACSGSATHCEIILFVSTPSKSRFINNTKLGMAKSRRIIHTFGRGFHLVCGSWKDGAKVFYTVVWYNFPAEGFLPAQVMRFNWITFATVWAIFMSRFLPLCNYIKSQLFNFIIKWHSCSLFGLSRLFPCECFTDFLSSTP